MARTTATTRTAVTDNRRAIRDMGSSLIFTGDNSVDITYDSSLFVGNTISITSWIRKDITYDASCIYGNYTSVSIPDCEYSFEISKDNKLQFYSNSGVANENEATGSMNIGGLNIGQWYHIAITWDGFNVKVYKDAILKTTVAFEHTPVASSNNYKIGERTGGASDFDGRINKVRLWGTTLTDDEILQDFLGKDVQTSSLAGEWLMDEGSGTSIADTSGNGNNGTTDATWTTDAPSGTRTTAPTRTAV